MRILISAPSNISKELINRGAKRFAEARRGQQLEKNGLVRFFSGNFNVDINTITKAIEESPTFTSFLEKMADELPKFTSDQVSGLKNMPVALSEFNKVRSILGLAVVKVSPTPTTKNKKTQPTKAKAPKKDTSKKKITTSKTKRATTKTSKSKKAP